MVQGVAKDEDMAKMTKSGPPHILALYCLLDDGATSLCEEDSVTLSGVQQHGTTGGDRVDGCRSICIGCAGPADKVSHTTAEALVRRLQQGARSGPFKLLTHGEDAA